MKRIIKVLAIVDTREKILETNEKGYDIWVRVPGTGIENECARCGKLHEIHVHVELENGEKAIVGLGCAKKESLDVAVRVKTLKSAINRLNKQLSLKSEYEKQIAKWNAVRETIIPNVPKVTIKSNTEYSEAYTCGDITLIYNKRDRSENILTLQECWIRKRMSEQGISSIKPEKRHNEEKIKQLEELIKKLTETEI